MQGFQVVNRNYGHWDVWQNDERIYRIRGGPGSYWVCGDHSKRDEPRVFSKTVNGCMSHICDSLMFELIVAEGQQPTMIEGWNV